MILAGGKGTRMQSRSAKALIEIHGQTMLERVVMAVRTAGIDKVCIVASKQLIPSLANLTLGQATVCLQRNQLGTAHALASAYVALRNTTKPQLGDDDLLQGNEIDCAQVLVCLADTPALQSSSLVDFMTASLAQRTPFHVIAMQMPDPHGYGRIVSGNNGKLLRIVEEQDADETIRAIKLCNSGIMLLDVSVAASMLDRISNDNQKHEYYLTDLLALAPTSIHIVDNAAQFMGVNDLQQLFAIKEYVKNNE